MRRGWDAGAGDNGRHLLFCSVYLGMESSLKDDSSVFSFFAPQRPHSAQP